MQAEPPFAQRESPPSLGSAITRRQAGSTAQQLHLPSGNTTAARRPLSPTEQGRPEHAK